MEFLAVQLPGEHFQQHRLAASGGTYEHSQATLLFHEEVKPGQGLFMRGTLVEQRRIKAARKWRTVQSPMRSIHQYSPCMTASLTTMCDYGCPNIQSRSIDPVLSCADGDLAAPTNNSMSVTYSVKSVPGCTKITLIHGCNMRF